MAQNLIDLIGADLASIDDQAQKDADAAAKVAAANAATAAAKSAAVVRATSDQAVTSLLKPGRIYVTPRPGIFGLLDNGNVAYVAPEDSAAITVPDPTPSPAPTPEPAPAN